MPSKISKNVRSQSVIPSKTVSNHAYTQGFQKTLCKSARLYLNVLGYRTILDNALLTYTDFYLKKQLHHRYKICKITSETLLSLKILSKKKKRLTGLRRHVSACKPHLKKRNSAKRYKFDIPDMPAFHKCMTGKISYLLMKSTEGYTLCKEFGSRENLHHSASS